MLDYINDIFKMIKIIIPLFIFKLKIFELPIEILATLKNLILIKKIPILKKKFFPISFDPFLI